METIEKKCSDIELNYKIRGIPFKIKNIFNKKDCNNCKKTKSLRYCYKKNKYGEYNDTCNICLREEQDWKDRHNERKNRIKNRIYYLKRKNKTKDL